MTTFEERLEFGAAHEQRVRRELEARGWEVTPWGQGILPELTRRVIRDTAPRFRHFPDLVAARAGEIVTVDAKARMHSAETGRYAVAVECVSFGLQFMAAFGIPVHYVFDNLGELYPTEVMRYGTRGTRATSGGAYYLVPERLAHHFDDVFGAPGIAYRDAA